MSHFVGAAGESIPIQVPPFHGIEPRLSLSYSSEARNGFAGMGWNLTGFSTIERVNGGWGVPRFDATDVFTLDGQTLLECPVGSTYPSCAAGGTHYTQQESYLKVKKVSDTEWHVYGKDGTDTKFTPIHTVTTYQGGPSYSLRLGQVKVTDTHGNYVDYAWDINAGLVNGNTYPSSVTYKDTNNNELYTIEFFREGRLDGPLTRGAFSDVGRQTDRLKTVLVRRGTTNIRGYRLSYGTSAATQKSMLTSVQMYGKDVVVTGGTPSSGTALPAQTFTYQGDGAVASFTGDTTLSVAGPPPTAPGTLENVVWSHTQNAVATGDGSTITAQGDVESWTKWGYSTRGISSGSGYVEFDLTAGGVRSLSLGTHTVFTYTSGGTHNVAPYFNGIWLSGTTANVGDKIRIEATPTGFVYKKNGAQFATEGTAPVYPLVLFASMSVPGDVFSNVRLSGSLISYWGLDCGGAPRFTGDFNGDGRQDVVCRNPDKSLIVTLATATGFANPTVWGAHDLLLAGAGDFSNDGRDDVVFFDSFWGRAYVGVSDGVDFGAITDWGYMAADVWVGYPTGYTSSACRMNGAKLGKVADYNGDGKMDISCYVPGGDPGLGDVQFVGISTGTAFAPAAFSNASCPQPYGNLATQGQADFNGDGRDDWFCTAANTGDTMVFFSAGNQFWYNDRILTNFCSASEYSFGDWNGDGATDAACANNLRAGLHTGDRFAVLDAPAPAAYCVTGQRVAADLDGDGAAEWICNNPGTPANDIEVRRWAGLAFGPAETWRGNFCGGNLTVADYNGDGKKDLICESSGAVIYAGTKNVKADLLVTSANGIGGSSTLAYTTTTQHLTTSSLGLPPKYIITSTTASDGRTTPATTTFQYFTGAQDDKERKFYGFQTIYEYPPALSNESASPIIARRFRIDAAAAGRPEVVNTYNSQQKILTKTVYSYTINEVTGAGARRQVLLSAVENFRFSGNTPDCWTVNCEARSTKVEYTYDTYGNVLQTTNRGDTGDPGKETTTLTDYVYNLPAYIVGTAGRTQTWEGVGTGGIKLGETRVVYDLNGSWSAMPTKGDVTRTEAWLNPSNTFVASNATYDARGNMATSTDPTGRMSTITYDATGVFPATASNGAEESTTTAWDPVCGVPSSTTDANGVVTLFATDNFCRPTTTTLPGPLVASSTTYLSLGTASAQRVRVETPGGGSDGTVHWSESYFDGFGRTYKTVSRGPVDGQPVIAESAFDQRGNVASQKAPYYSGVTTSPVTTFEYDALNRLIKTNLPGGGSRTTNYTGLSQDWSLFKTESVNELGQTTRTFSDVLGRVRTTTQVSATLGSPTTTREYDRLGRMTKLIDPAGNEWTYDFDTLGRTTSKHDPDAGNATFTYDAAGRLLTQVDAKNQATILEYDNAGRLKKKTTREGGLLGTVKDAVETTYGTNAGLHNVGRVTQMVTKDGGGLEKTGKLAFEYDALGQVVKQTRTIDGQNYVVEKAFDAAGYLRGIKYPDNDVVGAFGGGQGGLTYDHAGRLSGIPGILTSVTYNALGAPLVQSNANSTTTTKAYDANRFWLTDIDTAAPGGVALQQLSYTLNASGMATSVGSNNINEQWTYEYDPDLNFLKSSVNGTAPGTANNQTWTYDNLGRFTGNSRVGTTYTYPSSGPTSVRPHAPTSISGGPLGTLTFSYDANGNLSTGNGRTITWDAENRIKDVTKGGTTTYFTYGPDGTRIKKVSGSTTVRYPFGDDYEINGTTVTKYISAGFGTIAKKVKKSTGTMKTYWLHTDRLGSVNAVTDNTGAQVLRQGFRTYGEIFGKTTVGGHTESLDYIGERTDSETGLTYLHARYYDPILGAFLSPDPIGADSNTYRYSFGDSVNFRDPSGLCGESYSGFSTNIHGVVTQTQPSSGVDCDRSDEGEIARSRAAFQNYLNDHSYPAPLRGRIGCVANPDQERCRPDPDDPCAIDPGAEGCGPVDPCAVDSSAEGCGDCPTGFAVSACGGDSEVPAAASPSPSTPPGGQSQPTPSGLTPFQQCWVSRVPDWMAPSSALILLGTPPGQLVASGTGSFIGGMGEAVRQTLMFGGRRMNKGYLHLAMDVGGLAGKAVGGAGALLGAFSAGYVAGSAAGCYWGL